MATKKKLAKALRLFTANEVPTQTGEYIRVQVRDGKRYRLTPKNGKVLSVTSSPYRIAKRAYKRGQMSKQDVSIVNSLIPH